MASLASTEQNGSLAPVAARDDWQLAPGQGLASELERVRVQSDRLAQALVHAWTERGLEAHANIGAYAYFALELLSLGAPPQLSTGCAQAMQQETAHAQACFSLARRYGARNVGPGPLGLGQERSDADLTSIVVGAVRRGCIGETVHALAAREALEHCQDPATREVLIRHQEAKAQQAQLAWRFIAWALRGAGRELVDHVRVAFLTGLTAKVETVLTTERDRALLRSGLLSQHQHQALEQRVLRDVVVPCMEALLARAGRASTPPPF